MKQPKPKKIRNESVNNISVENVYKRFVKKAGKWCVTYWEEGAKKLQQKQEWFLTEEEAEQFIKNKKNEKKDL